MNEQLFRKKSIDRISSPEQLNEYIRVANPSVWIILSAVLILLVGVCVWGVLGHLDTTLSTVAIAQDNKVTVYVKEADIQSVTSGMEVRLLENTCTIGEIAPQPVAVDETFTDYVLHVGNLQKGEWVYAVEVSGEVKDGIYKAEIVTESVSPMSFVLN